MIIGTLLRNLMICCKDYGMNSAVIYFSNKCANIIVLNYNFITETLIYSDCEELNK